MAHLINNQELEDLIDQSWDDLCQYAYEQFLNYGRGFIGIDRTSGNDDYQLIFVIQEDKSKFDPTIKALVANYNPETELVLHFACAQNQYRTVRLKSQNGRGPKSIWEESTLKTSEN